MFLQFFSVALEPNQNYHTRTFWLGGSNLSKYFLFTWKSSGKPIDPALWEPIDPDTPDEEQCVNICWSEGFEQFKLSANMCKLSFYFICQVTK